MIVRKVQEIDTPQIYNLVRYEWEVDVADRIIEEVNGAFESSRWRPTYYVALDAHEYVCGFAGFVPSHILYCVYELNGIVIEQGPKGLGVGKKLTEKRLEEITKLGGTFVMLMTKQVSFFSKFGFRSATHHGEWVLMIKELADPNFE